MTHVTNYTRQIPFIVHFACLTERREKLIHYKKESDPKTCSLTLSVLKYRVIRNGNFGFRSLQPRIYRNEIAQSSNLYKREDGYEKLINLRDAAII